jgi:radical SAM PhpK family P-methyltransferase
MQTSAGLDCIVVGYNDVPFEKYTQFLGNYGKDSEAYRDLKFSFVDIGGKATNYVDLLNYALSARGGDGEWGAGPMKSGEIPNLAAVYLSNFLRKRGLGAKYVNLFHGEKEKFAGLLQQKPLCVAITTTFYVLNFPVNEIVQFVRSHNPDVCIVVGGPLVANHLRNLSGHALQVALEDMKADYYVTDSQGEATLANLVEALKDGRDVRGVPNLVYVEDGVLAQSRALPETNSMDEVGIEWADFAKEENLGRTIQMRTARSCAFKCSFCNYPTRAGKLTLAGLETIEAELESIRAIGDVQNVVFIDDTFNVPLPRFKDVCRMMIKKNYGFNWFSYFRCSNSDEEAFDLMAASGCKGVFLGIESGSPTILKNMNKAATIERYAEGIRALRERGITTFGSFILGFPGETEETVAETVNFIRENKPDFYRAQMWYCEPGTPIARQSDLYKIRGEGFGWEHATMSSLEAMDHIDRMFLTVKESVWLPQWSFDFWFIPYALGKGIPIAEFKKFVSYADKLLAMDIAYCPDDEKQRMQKKYLRQMVDLAKTWPMEASERLAFSGAATEVLGQADPHDFSSSALADKSQAY